MKITKVYYICDKCGKRFEEEDRYMMPVFIPKKNTDRGNYEYDKNAESVDLCPNCGKEWFQAHAKVDYDFFQGENETNEHNDTGPAQ